MKETTRQFYLSALGIDVWEARYPLPGAAPSAVQAVDDASEEPWQPQPTLGEQKVGFASGSVQSLDQVKSVLEEEVDSTAADVQPDASSLPVAHDDAGTDSTLSLQAAFWHGRGLSLAADVGANSGREIQLQLAKHIMQALGEAEVTPEIMQWPPFENRALPGNDDAAFDRLLKTNLVSSPSSSWLILGPESIEILSPRFREQGHEVQLSSELTLSRLVSDGNAKRELWETIKQSGLHRSLGNGDGK